MGKVRGTHDQDARRIHADPRNQRTDQGLTSPLLGGVQQSQRYVAIDIWPNDWRYKQPQCIGLAYLVFERKILQQLLEQAQGGIDFFPESSFGLMPGCGGSVRLAGIVGRSKATELILSGRNFSAGDAHRWGLVQRVVPRKTVIEETLKLAEKLK